MGLPFLWGIFEFILLFYSICVKCQKMFPSYQIWSCFYSCPSKRQFRRCSTYVYKQMLKSGLRQLIALICISVFVIVYYVNFQVVLFGDFWKRVNVRKEQHMLQSWSLQSTVLPHGRSRNARLETSFNAIIQEMSLDFEKCCFSDVFVSWFIFFKKAMRSQMILDLSNDLLFTKLLWERICCKWVGDF